MTRATGAQLRIEEAAVRLFSERGNTQISVLELAKEAGVARGTIYNNVDSTEALFQRIAARFADEMHQRIVESVGFLEDPAAALAREIRFFVRRAHEEPAWGWFVFRFGLSDDGLRDLLHGMPRRAMEKGRRLGRYHFREELLPGVLVMIGGCTLSAMFMVLEGHATWRVAGSTAAELVLRAAGVDPDEAQRLANTDLPALAPFDPSSQRSQETPHG